MNGLKSLLLLGFFCFAVFSRLYGESLSHMNIAHRGARSLAPENTIPAFEAAVKTCKADMIELDVHLSNDGVPIVFHDDTLERCTDVRIKFPDRVPWRLGEFTAAELLSLDAGSWFVQEDPFEQIKAGQVSEEDIAFFQSGKVRIPTLKAALEVIRELGCSVNIELKNYPSYYPGLADAALKVVRELKMEQKILFSSFDHEILLHLGKLAPEIPRAALVDQPISPIKEYFVDTLKVNAYNPGLEVLGFNSIGFRKTRIFRTDFIEQAKKAGLGVYVWTANEPELLEILLNAGVDGIFTDFPQRLSELILKRKQQGKKE